MKQEDEELMRQVLSEVRQNAIDAMKKVDQRRQECYGSVGLFESIFRCLFGDRLYERYFD